MLIKYLKSLHHCAVAFSGGVDSTFLLFAAKQALGNNVVAITIVSPYMPAWEIEEAKNIAETLQVKHKCINIPFMEEIRFNPENRCYLCKKEIFSLIINESRKENITTILDGTNADDLKDYRPGLKALQELKIKSPLLESGFTKEEIRMYSKEFELPTFDKSPLACLLSRIPYGTEITNKELERIEKSELFLMNAGFKNVRVRSHGNIARIEVGRNERKKFFDEKLFDVISKQLKEYGYTFVSLELEGYKCGNMN